MEAFTVLLQQSGLVNIGWDNLFMYLVAGTLIYLAIRKEYEPLLLIPIGFGILLANFPMADMSSYGSGLIGMIYVGGIKTELLPPIIFLGVGALTDFRPLLGRPLTFLLGAAAQLGIFIAALGAAYLFGFSPQEAASIGIIGGADGPTSIFLSAQLAPHLLGPVALAAYSYMALVPIIQPPVMRLLTTKKERAIQMGAPIPVSERAVIWFPICTAAITVLAVPSSGPLIGMLMFGNLLRESGVTDRLKKDRWWLFDRHRHDFPGYFRGRHHGGRAFPGHTTLMVFRTGCSRLHLQHCRWNPVRKADQPVPAEREENQPLHRRCWCFCRSNGGPGCAKIRFR